MAGLGRFKLTDALPDQPALGDILLNEAGGSRNSPLGARKDRAKGRHKAGGSKDRAGTAGGLVPDPVAEAQESTQARTAEASARDRLADIGRGNQQAGHQRAK
jgi:hypothetical protein